MANLIYYIKQHHQKVLERRLQQMTEGDISEEGERVAIGSDKENCCMFCLSFRSQLLKSSSAFNSYPAAVRKHIRWLLEVDNKENIEAHHLEMVAREYNMDADELRRYLDWVNRVGLDGELFKALV